MREKKITYFEARNDEYYMPSTNKQGWGSLFGVKTQLEQTESDGVRTRTRTPL